METGEQQVKVVPRDVAVGRIKEIQLDLEGVEAGLLNVEDQETPVVLVFKGPTGFYIPIYDHRQAVREAFQQGGDQTLQEAFESSVPCVGGYRIKGNRQYIVLADLGTLDIRDGGEEEALVLIRFDREAKEKYRVAARPHDPVPMHRDTKIAVCEARPQRP